MTLPTGQDWIDDLNSSGGSCGSGAVPVFMGQKGSGGTFYGCVGVGSFSTSVWRPQQHLDGPFLDLNDLPYNLRFTVLLDKFLNTLDGDAAEEAKQAGLAWIQAVTQFENGEIGLSELKNFDSSALDGWSEWDRFYDQTMETASVLDENADIREILRRNGYSDEAIEDILSAEVKNDRFTGNNVLSNALCEIGYSNCSDWGVTAINPTGDSCMNEDGEGTYQNGQCVTDTSEGKLCYNTENGVKVEGKRDANGQCVSLGSGDDDGGDDGGTDDEGTFEDYVNEVGEDIANTAKDIYDAMKDVLTECVGSPLDCIKKIGTVLEEQGIPEHCKDLEDCATADGTPDGGYCWKDCVTFNVLSGLPIPIPNLPGFIEVGTYRDFEDFLKGIGKSIEDFFEDPAGTVEGWIDAIIDKIKGIFTDVSDTDPSAIMDWLKGIFGAAVAGWVWGQIEEELNVIFPFTEDPECPEDPSEIDATNFEQCGYKQCDDGTYVKTDQSCPEEPVEDFDCSTVGRPQTEGAQEADDCGESCLEDDFVINPNSGHCYDPNEVEPDEDKQDCDEKGRVWDEAKDECSDTCQNPKYEVDDVSGECGPVNEENTCTDEFREKNDDGSCGDYCLNGDPAVDGEPCPDPNVTEVDCDDPQNADHPDCATTSGGTPCEDGVSIMPYISAIDRRNDWYERCLSTHCWQGYDQPAPKRDASGNCPGDINCDDPQSDAEYEQCPEWKECPSGTPKWVKNIADCETTGGFTCTDENATNTNQDGPCECPDPYTVSNDGTTCVAPEDNTCPDTNRIPNEDGTCSDECKPGYVLQDDLCVSDPTFNCNLQNRVTNDDGSCGECLPGFIEDPDGFDECIQAPPDCNDCSCAEYAAENPIECTECPDGQSYCESTGKCETPENCNPTDPPDDPPDDPPGGGSGGGGSGGRGVPSGLFTDITANPELLGRKRIPQTDPFAGIFDTGEDFPIASFLSNGNGLLT